MVQIGRYRIGIAPLSMIAVFIALSVCAIVTAFHRPRAGHPVPYLILLNEGMALLATLVYGIFAHFTIAIINRIKGYR